MKWINPEKQLPPIYDMVIVSLGIRGLKELGHTYYLASYHDSSWFDDMGCSLEDDDHEVIWWSHISEPPNKK